MDLVIPTPRKAPRWRRDKLGHFVDDVGYDGFAHYLEVYRAAMAELPPFDAQFDVPTAFGTVRVYRFGPEPARRWCSCRAAMRPPRCGGSICRHC
jgi:hypothetical protein